MSSHYYMEQAEAYINSVPMLEHASDHELHLYMFYICFKLGLADLDVNALDGSAVPRFLRAYLSLRERCGASLNCRIIKLLLNIRFMNVLKQDPEQTNILAFECFDLMEHFPHEGHPIHRFCCFLASRVHTFCLSKALETGDSEKIEKHSKKVADLSRKIYPSAPSINLAGLSLVRVSMVLSKPGISQQELQQSALLLEEARHVIEVRTDLSQSLFTTQLKKRLGFFERILKIRSRTNAEAVEQTSNGLIGEIYNQIVQNAELDKLNVLEVALRLMCRTEDTHLGQLNRNIFQNKK